MSEVGRLMGDLIRTLEAGKIGGDKLTIALEDAQDLYSTMYGMGMDLTKKELLWDEIVEDYK